MAESALAGVFREYTLTYQRETGNMTEDDRGNPVPETEPVEVVINFRPYQFAQLVFQEGADPKTVRGRGTFIDPTEPPAGVVAGTEFDMTYAGVAGKLQITQIGSRALADLDTILGRSFIGQWRAAV